MFRHLFMLLSFLILGLFETSGAGAAVEGESGGEGEGEGAGESGAEKNGNTKGKKPDGVTDEIQEWINGLITKESKAAEKRGATAAQAAIDQANADAKAEADRVAQEKAGDYETAKAELIADRDKYKTENETLVATNAALQAWFDADFDAATKDLHPSVLAFKPDDDASFETKKNWLTKAKAEHAKLVKDAPRGNGQHFSAQGAGNEPIKSGLKKRQFLQ